MANALTLPDAMKAMRLMGHGDIDQLVYDSDTPRPEPRAGEVLVEITATAKNNTDRKAREGLYPTRDKGDVTSFAIGGDNTLTFPRIQGADIVGRIAAVGDDVDAARIGERGLLDFNIYADDRRDINLTPDYYGHGADGGYAEYVAVPADQFHTVDNPNLADAELASMGMCSYQTAYHMMTAAKISADERVLVEAADLGFALTADEERTLADTAHRIIEAIRAKRTFSHYSLGDVGPIPFLHFMGPVETVEPGLYRSRSATYVHPGVICRSTTGTSARLALMNHQDLIEPGDPLQTVSLRNTRFIGEFTSHDKAGDTDVVNNTVTGRSYVIAHSEIIANSEDPMVAHLELGAVLGNSSSP